MSIAEVVAGLRRAIAVLDAAIAATDHSRRAVVLATSSWTAAASGSTHPASHQAVTAAAAAQSGCETIRRQLLTARDELETYIAAITGSGSSPGPSLSTGTPIKDPAFERGPLGSLFRPGVFQRGRFAHQHERLTAEHLADRHGANVYARRAVSIENVPNPDAMVRWRSDDPGSITEFKRPTRLSYNAVRKRVREAGRQLTFWSGGDVVIDGRAVALPDNLARDYVTRAFAEARRKGEPVPDRVHVILGDGSMMTIHGGEGVDL